MFPSLRGRCDLVFSDTTAADRPPVTWCSTPHRMAWRWPMRQKLLLPASRSLTSPLTSAFKDLSVFEKWYKLPHSCPDLAAIAAYGLVGMNRDAIRNAQHRGQPRLLSDHDAASVSTRCSKPASSTPRT